MRIKYCKKRSAAAGSPTNRTLTSLVPCADLVGKYVESTY